MTARTRRVAVVGIDGSGKSSVVRQLGAAAGSRTVVAALTCPDFHDTPDAPLRDLSRRLRLFSDQADILGHPVIKAAALYLQMTLYGPVERFFLDTFAPSVLICERHPVVESMVYGPLYVQLAGAATPGSDDDQAIRDLLAGHDPQAMAAIEAWHAGQRARLGDEVALWGVLGDVARLVDQGPEDALRGFATRYQTTLPDEVIWLDVPPEQAMQRCAERIDGKQLEAHETLGTLTALRERYRQARETFRQCAPQVVFHTIDASDAAGLEQALRACVAEARLPVGV